ncbi:MAG TPA: UDP-glucose 4-epimerase GalE [Stellaceae bacterium]|nr:UDP-glucose 4-epimerase GalE [Stellaceae bacterium]
MGKGILVTGGAGYIGAHACKALAKAGYEPVAYDNLVYGHKEAVRWGPFVEGDIGDRAKLAETIRRHGIGAVMHFAAFAYVGESVEQPEKYFQNNVVNTLAMLEAMRATGVKQIVFSSTCATYGLPEQMPIREHTPQRPVNPYGETKLMIERALHWYGVAHGLRSVALRYFNAAGADPDGEIGEDHNPETHLIPLILDAATGRRPHIGVFGTDYPTPDGTAIRDYIHVQDLADAHVRALRYLDDGGATRAFNLGTGHGHSVRATIEAARRVTSRPIPSKDSPRRAGDPPVLVADAALAKEKLGWMPALGALEQIIGTAWAWHQKHFVPAQPNEQVKGAAP